MSSISGREKKKITKLLNRLDSDNLLSLAQTITANKLTLSTKQEAVDAILNFEKDAVSLLKRKKMHKKSLFLYLAEESVYVDPQSEKNDLIKKCLDYWGSDKDQLIQLKDGGQLKIIAENIHVGCPADNQYFEPYFQPCTAMKEEEPIEEEEHIQEHITDNRNVPSCNQDKQLKQTFVETEQTICYTSAVSNTSDLTMAVEFVGWFYTLLNTQSTTTTQEDFGPQHFYKDCRLNLLSVVGEMRTDQYTGGELVASRLLAFVREESLKFNPNDTPGGLHMQSTPHGLTVISCAGTLHQNSGLIGVFEQQFGLARDPEMQNNWRIKFSNLKLASQMFAGLPTLDMTEKMFAIDER